MYNITATYICTRPLELHIIKCSFKDLVWKNQRVKVSCIGFLALISFKQCYIAHAVSYEIVLMYYKVRKKAGTFNQNKHSC